MQSDIESDTLSAIANPRPVYEIYTLVDITDTGVISPKRNQKGFYQAQNLNTYLQVLGLRTQIINYQVSTLNEIFSGRDFVNFPGVGNIWKLAFQTESTDPWNKSGDNLYWLIHDFAGTPIHTNLDESVKIKPEIVNTIDTLPGEINTRFNIQALA
jgi:hypothetical protein